MSQRAIGNRIVGFVPTRSPKHEALNGQISLIEPSAPPSTATAVAEETQPTVNTNTPKYAPVLILAAPPVQRINKIKRIKKNSALAPRMKVSSPKSGTQAVRNPRSARQRQQSQCTICRKHIFNGRLQKHYLNHQP